MAHRRIRAFNTATTYPEQRLDNDLAQAVVARGATVFLRGQCPQDLETAEDVGVGDPVAQAHKVMQNIRQLVEEAGGQMAHVCKLVVYLTDILKKLTTHPGARVHELTPRRWLAARREAEVASASSLPPSSLAVSDEG